MTQGNIYIANASNQPSWSTATYPATTTANQLLYSSATNTIGGLASANSGVLTTSSSGVPSIDTTNFQVLTTGVQMKGNNTNTAPPAGFIGQTITASATSVGLSNGTPANVTSISLTAGIWDVSSITYITNSGSSTTWQSGISTTSATFSGNAGPDYALVVAALASGAFTLVNPSVRATLSSTTTYYLVAQSTFTTGASSANGRITATRVG